jgi:hypothetical protein
MKKVMLVHIDGKAYSMGKKTAQTLLDTARDKYRKEKKMAIIGLEKGRVLEMRRDEFKSAFDLRAEMHAYMLKGFTVHYVP